MKNNNVFDTPKIYIDEIIEKVKIPTDKRKQFSGKSIASVFFTKFCGAGCSHCFFKSGKKTYEKPQEQFEFSDDGFEKFVQFINKSNNGYLLVIGGGEPFIKQKYVIETVKRVKTDRIVIVTNGMWGKSYKKAKDIIFRLYDAYKSREDNAKIILRLSIDRWHIEQLGDELIFNIVNIFKENFKNEINFELQIHTLIGDKSIDEICQKFGNCKIIRTDETGMSDNEQVLKVSPYRSRMEFDDGYIIYIGIAKLFYSNLRQNLKQKADKLKLAEDIFEEDMEFSAFDNQSIIPNLDGTYGLNFWINYNGNVTFWGNQQLYDLNNIYINTFDDTVSKSFDNIISYSYIDKGHTYRKNIINEVNHKAVLRSLVINIRDYSRCNNS